MKAILNFSILLILVLFNTFAYSQQPADTLQHKTIDTSLSEFADTSKLKADTLKTIFHPEIKSYRSVVNELLSSNKFINVKEPAVIFNAEKKQMTGKEFLFYALCILVFILGMYATFYQGFFNKGLRV